MTATDRGAHRLQMGRVVVQTFQAIRENIFLFSALSLFTVVPSFLLRYQQSERSEEDYFSISYLLLVTAFVVGFFLLTAAITKAFVLERTRHRATLRDCLAEVARDFYPLAVIAILAYAVSMTAVIVSVAEPAVLALLIPGFYILVFLSVVVPVRVIERRGIVATFQRSMDLTSGHRWPIFGLLIAATVLSIASELLVYAAFGYPETAEFAPSSRAAILLLVAGDFFNGLINAVAPAILYFELRLIKEGVAPETVAAEFD